MGMAIFETSGSFNPSNYGLIAGDVLDVICIGGGSSGAYSVGAQMAGGTGQYSPSVAGGASSIGGMSSDSGLVMGKGEIPDGSVVYEMGGGAGGYMPGVPFYGGNGGTGFGLASAKNGNIHSLYCNPSGSGNKGAYGTTTAAGGNGYGAGGAGVCIPYTSGAQAVEGGDAGKIRFGSIVLANTSALSVTVGSGGINAQSSDVHGAPGLVIVFW